MNAETRLHSGSRWFVTFSALACVAYAGGAPGADRSNDVPSITVGFADLNVASAAGASRLYGRIQEAARSVCGGQPALADLQRMQAWKSCYSASVSDAVSQVNLPTLTALHDSKTGRKTPQLAAR